MIYDRHNRPNHHRLQDIMIVDSLQVSNVVCIWLSTYEEPSSSVYTLVFPFRPTSHSPLALLLPGLHVLRTIILSFVAI